MEFELFYTTREAAEMLGVTLNTFNRWIREGKIHAYTIKHRCHIVFIKDLDEFNKARLNKEEKRKLKEAK